MVPKRASEHVERQEPDLANPHDWVRVAERMGLATLFTAVLVLGIKSYWLDPDKLQKESDRAVAAKKADSDRMAAEKLVETAAQTANYQQTLIKSLMEQTTASNATMKQLGDVVAQLGTRQLDTESLVKQLAMSIQDLSKRQAAWEDISRTNLDLNKTQMLRLDELQKNMMELQKIVLQNTVIISEQKTLMQDAKTMMAPVPAQREETNKLLNRMLKVLEGQKSEQEPKPAPKSET